MKYLLFIFLQAHWLGTPDQVLSFPDKQSCYETLAVIQQQHPFMAYCAPEGSAK